MMGASGKEVLIWWMKAKIGGSSGKRGVHKGDENQKKQKNRNSIQKQKNETSNSTPKSRFTISASW